MARKVIVEASMSLAHSHENCHLDIFKGPLKFQSIVFREHTLHDYSTFKCIEAHFKV